MIEVGGPRPRPGRRAPQRVGSRSWFAVASLALLLPAARGTAEDSVDQVLVLGGPAALSRLLAPMDEHTEGFLSSLNRVLLGTIRLDHRWEEVPERVRIVEYLSDARTLGAKLPAEVTLGLDSAAARQSLQRLAGLMGYRLAFRGDLFETRPAEGDEEARRRSLSQALGIDFDALRERLRQEGSVAVTIPWLPVVLPLPLAEWAEIVGRRPERVDAVSELAKDQRLGLLLKARRRLDASTRETLDAIGLRWFYGNSPETLYRYAAAIQVRDGKVVVPGGPAAENLWRELVGASPADSRAFLPALVTRRHGRAAYFWHALHFAPPRAVEFHLGGGDAVRRLYRRLDEAAVRDLDEARGGDQGFPALVRSVGVRDDGKGLDLPGGPGLWYEAIKGDRVPTDAAGLAEAAARGRERGLDDAELLARALTETVDRPAHEIPALPRLLQAASFFVARPDLATPENVVAFTRATDSYGPALALADALEIGEPETLRDYLLALRGFDRLAPSPESELLLVNFQAGVEWIRLLALGRRLPHPTLERFLQQWVAIHRGQESPWALAEAEIAWSRGLLGALPEPPPGWSGGGPLERALLYALAGGEPVTFSYQSLGYTADRGRDLAAAMHRSATALSVLSPDTFLALVEAFDALVAAAGRADESEVQLAAGRLGALLGGLGRLELPSPISQYSFRERLPEHWRSRWTGLVERARREPSRKLPGLAAELRDSRRFLAVDHRMLLLAPAYLTALGERPPASLAQGQLLLKHQLFRQAPGVSELDARWRQAELTKAEHEELGLVVRGHVGSVGTALADVTVSALRRQGVSAGVDLERDRVWYTDFVTTPWFDIGLEATDLVARLVAAGGAVLAGAGKEIRGGSEGPFSAFAERRIPRARLERWAAGDRRARVSASEAFALGLAASAGDDFGPPLTDVVPAPGLAELGGRLAGPTGSEALQSVGASTPHLNGRSVRWAGTWPPYEAVENEYSPLALVEREVLDLRISALAYAGRRGLPGAVAGDLAWKLLEDALATLRSESRRDWEGLLLWLDQRDDAYFDDLMRRCLSEGLYRLQAS